ncbi:AEC family transporter [Halobellus sp. EA9]|uniref:AEC family transporter n=1 Tax=Halobellus sp. EA9 TaxID=3421647 RepID=UPI003EBEA6CE
MEVLGRLLGLLVLLFAGTGLRRVGVLGPTRTKRLNDLTYYVALPALVFVSTYDRAIGDLLTPALVAGSLAVLIGTAGVAWLLHRNRVDRDRRGVAIVQSYHSNLGYLGLPLIAATFSGDVTAVASVVLGVVSLTQVPLTIAVLTGINGAGASIGDELTELVRSPVLLTLVLGLTVGSVGVSVPGPLTVGLDALGSLALPLALLCVGASLQFELPDGDLGTSAAVVALKMAWMPALAWAVFSTLDVGAAAFTAAVVMLGMPTAVSTYVFANELGGDPEFASLNVFLTTLASVGTLFVLIQTVG